MTKSPDTVSARIAAAVKASTKTMRQVSLDAGLSVNRVSQLINKGGNPGVATLAAIAQATGTPLADLLDDTQAPPEQVHGMAETEATPWTPPPPDSTKATQAIAPQHLAQTLAPSARHCATYRITRAFPGLGLLPNDLVIVDLSSGQQSAGDIVIATIADPLTGEATTVVRRFLPPYLISGDPVADTNPEIVDNNRVSILGRVAASARAPDISNHEP